MTKVRPGSAQKRGVLFYLGDACGGFRPLEWGPQALRSCGWQPGGVGFYSEMGHLVQTGARLAAPGWEQRVEVIGLQPALRV